LPSRGKKKDFQSQGGSKFKWCKAGLSQVGSRTEVEPVRLEWGGKEDSDRKWEY
jgi:hypothetical protein